VLEESCQHALLTAPHDMQVFEHTPYHEMGIVQLPADSKLVRH